MLMICPVINSQAHKLIKNRTLVCGEMSDFS